MKVTQDNHVKLAKNDIRVGNFVVSVGEKSIRMTDISELTRSAVSKDTVNGAYLAMAAKEGNHDRLHLEAAITNHFLCVAKDEQCMKEIVESLNACALRHPDIYGKVDGTDAEHEAAATEVREMREFEEELKNLPDGDNKERL